MSASPIVSERSTTCDVSQRRDESAHQDQPKPFTHAKAPPIILPFRFLKRRAVIDVVSVTQATRTKIKSTGDPVVLYEGGALRFKTIALVSPQ